MSITKNERPNFRGELKMNLTMRSVAIIRLPERLDASVSERFLADLIGSINADRPSIVLDCGKVREMNTSTVLLLLCCLEEAMKRNGDVVLAAVSPDARRTLMLNDVDGLFRIFETSEAAKGSFHARSAKVSSG